MFQRTNKKTKIKVFSALPFFLLTLSTSSIALAQSATLKQCQSWSNKIEHYQEKRKKGGSGKKMDEWKGKIRKYRDKFRKNKCSRYGRRLG
ncbi:hypothetical protein [Microbulbifer variabilis]|uniref:Uncharacterized protein n=1 Tax=Microbulbifer variabilis TaxID=266805 RepID=A0ABY4VHP0_9GAMM|nr:hypothetical protein [Microbulbifer variabilis]USD22911.1 hypothetical protein MJO52_07155 [Microbulbifer variabilis]